MIGNEKASKLQGKAKTEKENQEEIIMKPMEKNISSDKFYDKVKHSMS